MQFPKEERLTSQKIIKELFSKGKAQFLYPLRVVYLLKTAPSADFPQVLFSIPKKNFKKATDRNWIRRRMREVYRLHKKDLVDENGEIKVASIGFIYIAKEKIPYFELKKKILPIFQRLKE